MTNKFTYTDVRFGFTYNVWLDANGDFFGAECRGEGFITPVTYDLLSELPPHPRSEIEQRIMRRKQAK